MTDPISRLNAALEGRYRIEREIGEGGMATVYLAEDLRHERNVALKVLKPELAAVVGAERFLTEIKTTANLQHPHILPLHDSGEADGVLYYVMPYVDGESLRDRIDREHQLPVDEAIGIATKVAGALQAAHERGVIHRDIKPGNILLSKGEPLVSDFGIALAVGAAGGGRLTETGLSVGTPHYMSPEQATGDAGVGPSTDIYALGCVLYEMLVGDPPYTGSTAQAILGKIIQGKPVSATEARHTVPAHVDATIQKALERLPADRFASAEEFAEALEGKRLVVPVPATGGKQATATGGAGGRTVAGIVGVAGVVVGILLTLLVTSVQGPPEPSSSPTAYGQIAMPGDITPLGSQVNTEVSPDGERMAFAGNTGSTTGIFLRSLANRSGTAGLVEGTEGATDVAGFSPDGGSLVFQREGRLWRVQVSGGGPTPVVEGVTGSWGEGGRVVFTEADGRLWMTSVEGGAPTALAEPDTAAGEIRYRLPHMLPGGNAAFFTIFRGSGSVDEAVLAVVTVPNGRVTELGLQGTDARFVLPGYIVFAKEDRSLWAAPFSPRSLEVSGPAVQVLDGISVSIGGVADYSVSPNGTLVWAEETAQRSRLVLVDRSGAARPLFDPGGLAGWPRVSGDGSRVAYTLRVGGLWGDIWYYDVVAETPTRVTLDGISGRPEWTPDRERIAFISTPSRGNNYDLHVRSQRWDRTESPDTLLASADLNGIGEISFGPPGGLLAVRTISGSAVAGNPARDIYVAPVDSATALRGFLVSPDVSYERPRVSPDGTLLAYVTTVNEAFDVFIQPLSGGGGRVQVSRGGGDEPVWSADGAALYYRTATDLVEATIEREPVPAVVEQRVLFADGYERSDQRANYDVLGDGFVMVDAEGLRGGATLSFVVNWGRQLGVAD